MQTVPGLETERLLLRPCGEEDVHAIARMDRDPDVYRFSEVRAFTPSKPPAEAALRRAMRSEFASGRHKAVWAIETKQAPGFRGLVGFTATAPDILGFPAQPDTLFLAYRLARAAWGQGFATEAVAAAIDFGFGALAAHALVAFTHAANARSRRVLEKSGMSATGMMLARQPGGGDGQLYLCFRRERASHGERLAAPRRA